MYVTVDCSHEARENPRWTGHVNANLVAPNRSAGGCIGAERLGLSSFDVTVILPTFNEGKNIRRLMLSVGQVVPHAQIVIVDDASVDSTAEVAQELAQRDPRIHVIHRSGERTFGGACRDAFRWALSRGSSLIIVMDADLSHDPAHLPALVGSIDSASDIVIGSRYIRGSNIQGWPLSRLLLSRCARFSSGLAVKFSLTDPTSGYRVYTRAALEAIDLSTVHAKGFVFQVEMLKRAFEEGLRVKEIPIEFKQRASGRSKMSWRHALEGAMRLLKWRFS